MQQTELTAQLGSLAANGDGNIQVMLLVDGQTVATFDSPPYRALWRLTPGDHQVQAVVVLSNGQRVESQSLPFRVVNSAP